MCNISWELAVHVTVVFPLVRLRIENFNRSMTTSANSIQFSIDSSQS
ncbi:unnamed protein product [Haemonchus placei]|uniref:Uncharacterized protein n=1 Tax=Haemonchus placei TaxID=6290 RepID=A0A3P7X0Z2_HAEPC|nr:unnamed protein product [Haemonchus placei]